jgi:hypothetical protein
MPVALRKQTEEPGFKEITRQYPTVPPLVILKIDVQRRGVCYTHRAISVMDDSIHQLRSPYIFGSRDASIPVWDFLFLCL